MLLKIHKLNDQGTANKDIMSTSHLRYLHVAQDVLKQIEATQTDAIAQASEMCAETIAADGLVYLFGSGHSRMPVEEIFHVTEVSPVSFPSLNWRLRFTTKSSVATGSARHSFWKTFQGTQR